MDIYGLMKMGLDATELRNRTIANNIVNINTPNYKRKYVTFEDSLKNEMDNVTFWLFIIPNFPVEYKVNERQKLRIYRQGRKNPLAFSGCLC